MSNTVDQPSSQRDVRPLHTLSGHTGIIWATVFLPDGQRLLTGSDDKTIRIWNVANGRQEGIIDTAAICSLVVTSDGRRVISSGYGRIAIWDVETHELVEEWKITENFPMLAISPDDQLVAYGRFELVIRQLNNGRHKHVIKTDVSSLCFSPEGSKLACGGSTNIDIYNVDSGQFIQTLVGHSDWVQSLQWSRDDTSLYSSSVDQTIRCWNTHTWKRIGEPWTGHTGNINSLSLSPDGTTIVSGSGDKTIRFWDTSGHPIGYPLRHDGVVYAVGFSLLNVVVASAGSSDAIYIWPAQCSDDNQPDGLASSLAPSISTDLSESHTRSPTHVHVSNNAFNTLDSSQLSPSATHSTLASHRHVVSEPSKTTPSPKVDPRKTSQTIDSDRLLQNVTSQTNLSPVPSSKYDGENMNSFPAPPDLTQHIVRLNELYLEGGSFGDVYRCHYNSPTGPIEVAVKTFRFKFTLEEAVDAPPAVKMVRRELGIWRRLDHPNVVPFLGTATGFGMYGSLALVSAWMPNGTLHKFLEIHGERLHIAHKLQFLLDIANGLDYLHTFAHTPITHGDLNGNNVLVDGNFTARLADFGLSSFIGNTPEGLTYLAGSTARPGTLRWSAPEQLNSEYQRSPKSDIYSFGCIALQLFSGEKPWASVREDVKVVLRLATGETPPRPVSRPIDDSHWELINSCWRPVDERPTASMLVSLLQELIDSCPPSLPLREVVAPLSSQNDPVSVSSSTISSPLVTQPVQDTVNGNSRRVSPVLLTRNNRSRESSPSGRRTTPTQSTHHEKKKSGIFSSLLKKKGH